MPQGFLSVILHAHLPFVRHPNIDTLSKKMVYEAMLESYLPCLNNGNMKETVSIIALLSHYLPR